MPRRELICSRCGKPRLSAWRSYCSECQREYDRDRDARKRAAALAEGNENKAVNDFSMHRRAVIWQHGPNGERLVTGDKDPVYPPPTGRAIYQPGMWGQE